MGQPVLVFLVVPVAIAVTILVSSAPVPAECKSDTRLKRKKEHEHACKGRDRVKGRKDILPCVHIVVCGGPISKLIKLPVGHCLAASLTARRHHWP